MESKTIRKLEALEMKAGLNGAGVFIIDNGKITSGGREYSKEEYEAIKKKRRTVTIVDDIEKKPDLSVLSVEELREIEGYILKRDSGHKWTEQEEKRIGAIMSKVK